MWKELNCTQDELWERRTYPPEQAGGNCSAAATGDLGFPAIICGVGLRGFNDTGTQERV